MMKEYLAPEIEIALFLTEDVMTASFGDNDASDPWE